MQQHATITEASFIHDANLRSSRRRHGRPIHRMLVSFSVAYFVGALVTDLAYWQMPDVTVGEVLDLADHRRPDHGRPCHRSLT